MYTIYTDGSCDNLNLKYGSSAFVVLRDKKLIHENVEFYQHTTNNRTEIAAAVNALNWLKHNFGSVDYILYTDSQLLVNIVMKWACNWQKNNWIRQRKGSVKNLDLVKEVYNLHLFHKGSFEWIKGHAGNEWNEYCDNLCFESDSYNIDKVL